MEKVQFVKPRQHRGTPTIKFLFKGSGWLALWCVAGYYLMDWYSKDHVERKRALGYYLDGKKWVEKRAMMSRLSLWNQHSPAELKRLKEQDVAVSTDIYSAQNVPGGP